MSWNIHCFKKWKIWACIMPYSLPLHMTSNFLSHVVECVKGMFTLLTGDHDHFFLNSLICWNMSGAPTSSYIRSPKIRVTMSEYEWQGDVELTCNPTCSRLNNVWWSSRFCSKWIQILGCPNKTKKWRTTMSPTKVNTYYLYPRSFWKESINNTILWSKSALHYVTHDQFAGKVMWISLCCGL